MKNLAVLGIVLACLLGGMLSCSTRQISQDEIVGFVDEIEKKAEYIDRQESAQEWTYDTQGRADSLGYYRDLQRALFADPQQLAIIEKYRAIVNDETYARRLELIYRRCLRAAIDAQPKIAWMADSLAGYYGDFRPIYQGQPYAPDDILKLMTSTKDQSQRQALFEAYAASGRELGDGLTALARVRNHAVSLLGYNSYYDLMLTAGGIDKADFVNLMGELDRLSAAPYRQALDSVREAMKLNDLRIWDIGFAFHRTATEAAAYYGADRQRNLLKSTLMGIGFKLQAWPIYYEPMVAEADGKGDPVLAVHVPDDIRIPTHVVDGIESLRRLFDQTGRALYAARVDIQDYLLAGPPAPCFDQGMGLIFSGLIETEMWQRKYAGMPEPLVLELLGQQSFKRLYNLRKLLLAIAFEQKLYADPFADMQKIYADLFEKYMMFPLGGDYPVWAASPESIVAPVTIQNRLIGECIAAQTYCYLMGKYGAVVDDQHTREFLVQNFFRFGARDNWQTLLKRGTGDKLKGQYYFDFPCN